MDQNSNRTLGKTKEEIRQRQITAIKAAVQLTLEKLEKLEKEKNDLQESIRVLKHDLYDLKDGRLDRIAERQELKKSDYIASVFRVEKISDQPGHLSPWYIEYELEVGKDGEDLSFHVSNSIVKMHAAGTYKLQSGDIKYL